MIELQEIFEVKYGVNLELNKLTQSDDGINFVSRTAKNNGVSAKVKPLDNVDPIPAGCISVAGGGSVLESFLQYEPFYSGRDMYYLSPKIELTDQQKLYYCACIKANKDKCVAGLCDGYCTKPVTNGNICPRLLKRQKCYTCSRYITTPEYLDAHKQHLANLEKQLEEGAIYGEHYAEHFIPTIEVLKVIIERLEGLQNGN